MDQSKGSATIPYAPLTITKVEFAIGNAQTHHKARIEHKNKLFNMLRCSFISYKMKSF